MNQTLVRLVNDDTEQDGKKGIFKAIFNEPLLLYSLIFTLIFAFGVGIASTNFGALVRYRIPLIPFYFPLIYVIYKSK